MGILHIMYEFFLLLYSKKGGCKMNLDLRQAILKNIKGKSKKQLTDMVDSAIEENEEKTLPGLGVIFEIIWQNTDSKTHESMINSLSKNINKKVTM